MLKFLFCELIFVTAQPWPQPQLQRKQKVGWNTEITKNLLPPRSLHPSPLQTQTTWKNKNRTKLGKQKSISINPKMFWKSWLDSWVIGMLNYCVLEWLNWIIKLLNFWIMDLLNYWIIELLDYWIIKSSNHWIIELLNYCIIEL